MNNPKVLGIVAALVLLFIGGLSLNRAQSPTDQSSAQPREKQRSPAGTLQVSGTVPDSSRIGAMHIEPGMAMSVSAGAADAPGKRVLGIAGTIGGEYAHVQVDYISYEDEEVVPVDGGSRVHPSAVFYSRGGTVARRQFTSGCSTQEECADTIVDTQTQTVIFSDQGLKGKDEKGTETQATLSGSVSFKALAR